MLREKTPRLCICCDLTSTSASQCTNAPKASRRLDRCLSSFVFNYANPRSLATIFAAMEWYIWRFAWNVSRAEHENTANVGNMWLCDSQVWWCLWPILLPSLEAKRRRYRGRTNFILPCSVAKSFASSNTGFHSARIPILHQRNRISLFLYFEKPTSFSSLLSALWKSAVNSANLPAFVASWMRFVCNVDDRCTTRTLLANGQDMENAIGKAFNMIRFRWFCFSQLFFPGYRVVSNYKYLAMQEGIGSG